MNLQHDFSISHLNSKGGNALYIDTKERGIIYEPLNPLNFPLYETLRKYQASLDGSRIYDDLIDVYINYEMDYKEGLHNEKATAP